MQMVTLCVEVEAGVSGRLVASGRPSPSPEPQPLMKLALIDTYNHTVLLHSQQFFHHTSFTHTDGEDVRGSLGV